MKKKELMKLARRIAEAEKIIQLSSDKVEIEKAKDVILSVSHNYAIGFEEMMEMDEAVQEILSKEYNISNS